MAATDTYQAPPQPVFKPRKKHSTIIGVRTVHFKNIVQVVIAGIAAFFLLGFITHKVDRPLSFATKASIEADLKESRDALVEAEAKGYDTLSSDEKQAYSEASANRVTATMTDEQIAAMVPQTEKKDEPAVNAAVRLILCIVVPTLCTFAWYVEVGHGYSLRTTALRFRAHLKRQRIFVRSRQS